MIKLAIEDHRLILTASAGDLAPRHESQLNFWKFKFDSSTKRFIAPEETTSDLIEKTTNYLTQQECSYELSEEVKRLIDQNRLAKSELEQARDAGLQFKEGVLNHPDQEDFISFLNDRIPRKLKEHQRKAALHLLSVKNGANFSVPGSGKTSVVLAVFQYLRERNEVDALFVVGPPACFGPWRAEYNETLGTRLSYEILAGGDIDERHSKYQVNRASVRDLYLTSFQTLLRDWEHVRILFEHQKIRFFFVIDEAHYIKQNNGAWANAALSVTRHATMRCILTGTPFPHSFADAFNLFDALWPNTPPISPSQKNEIKYLTDQSRFAEASVVLNNAVSPLFYRVRKRELKLACQRFHDPICVPMNKYEKQVYDTILDRIRQVSQSEYFRDIDLVMRLKRGRIMRLRQCLSYTFLLNTAIEEYSEDLLSNDMSLASIIQRYNELETPAKLEALLSLINRLRRKGEKVVIWSNFVRTLELIRDKTRELGAGVRLIYGGTPHENEKIEDGLTREGMIRDFVRPDSDVDILVANPAACAESISLHKTCSHAVYYDLSYNCAQYLQSLDRIHRVGGSEKKEAHYHFIQYENSLDQDILANLQGKVVRMSEIIDQDYPIYSLDMFTDDDELEAYDRLFGQQN